MRWHRRRRRSPPQWCRPRSAAPSRPAAPWRQPRRHRCARRGGAVSQGVVCVWRLVSVWARGEGGQGEGVRAWVGLGGRGGCGEHAAARLMLRVGVRAEAGAQHKVEDGKSKRGKCSGWPAAFCCAPFEREAHLEAPTGSCVLVASSRTSAPASRMAWAAAAAAGPRTARGVSASSEGTASAGATSSGAACVSSVLASVTSMGVASSSGADMGSRREERGRSQQASPVSDQV